MPPSTETRQTHRKVNNTILVMKDDDNDHSTAKNPFVRFKHHIDERVATGLNSVLGIPSIVSSTFAAGSPQQETSPSAHKSTTTMPDDTAPSHELSLPSPSPNPQTTTFSSLDTLLSTFLGRSRSDAHLGWLLFLTRSPYSPLLLDSHLQSHPTAGTWSDAFSDLLRASSGLPLSDPQHDTTTALNSFGSLLYGPSYHNDIAKQAETYLWQLRQNRLDEVFFPFKDERTGYRSPKTMQEWVSLRKAEAEADPWAQVHGWVDGLKKAEEVWRGVEKGVERVMEEVDRAVEKGAGAVEKGLEGAQTEEDAYRELEQRRDGEGGRREEKTPWDALFEVVKQFGGKEEKAGKREVLKEEERTKPTWIGGTKTVTEREWVDESGAVHTEKIVSVKDGEGHETSRRVSHSVRSGEGVKKERDVRIHHVDEEEGVVQKDEKKPNGWFWSRR